MLTEILEEMGFSLPHHEAEKPLVGVSACLLGRPVRYDGDHKRDERVADQLSRLLRFSECCPEVGIGMPVPRSPIQVVKIADQFRVRGVQDPTRDVTEALTRYADDIALPLCGFIFKARSPSCGHLTTPVYDPEGEQIGMASGAFARRLHQRYPRIPLCNESDLEKPAFVEAFVLHVYCYYQWHHAAHQGEWLAHMREKTEQLDEPLHTGTRFYLDKLGQAMH